MLALKSFIRDIADFPQPGIVFRDITPLLRHHLSATLEQLSAQLHPAEWAEVDAVAGIEARGFILAAALAARHSKGFVPIRKKGKLPPPVMDLPYRLEYGTAVVEVQPGSGRLLIVDDVLATGGTMTAAASLAESAGFEIRALLALIDLNLAKEARWQDHAIRSVIKY
jgi:adenine phosphoribosyltransferase